MKKNFVILMLALSTVPVFAQPYPRPMDCQVAAVDRYNRVVAYFYGRANPGNGVCHEGLRRCNNEIRRRGWWDVHCVQLRNRW